MSTSGDSLTIVVYVAVPLLVGLTFTIGAFRSNTRWERAACGTIGSVLMLLFLLLAIGLGPYAWALHLESKWVPADPKTKTELESYLSLYSEDEIQPEESEWGHSHELRDGDRMIQYMLLWGAPLDVVYDSNDAIIRIYTSYE